MLCGLALSMCDLAHAEGYSADIELLRPTFADGALPGVDRVSAPDQRGLRLGVFTQYEKSPLILRSRDGTRLGSVVGNRLAADLGVSFDASRRLTLRAAIPLAAQFGSSLASYGADGVGLRDATIGATLRLTRQRSVVHLGLRADAALPIGRKRAWLGEDQPRGGGGLVLGGVAGPVLWSAEAGAVARSPVVTEYGLTVSSEAYYGAGVRVAILPDRLSVVGGTFGRMGFKDPFGGGLTGLEVLGGARWAFSDHDAVELVVGKGFANGYGTTDMRVGLGYTWSTSFRNPPVVEEEPEPEPDQAIVDRLPTATIVTEPDIEPEAPPPPPPEPLAKLVNSRIEVRDPIKFAVGTNRVLPESIPTLRAVGALVRTGELLLIEGRASVEGQYRYNYDLSVSRAQIIYEELLRTGISANNLAWRALGEVAPVVDGTDEAQLAENRRVSFYVIPLPGGPPPQPPTIVLPWDGTSVPARPAEVSP